MIPRPDRDGGDVPPPAFIGPSAAREWAIAVRTLNEGGRDPLPLTLLEMYVRCVERLACRAESVTEYEGGRELVVDRDAAGECGLATTGALLAEDVALVQQWQDVLGLSPLSRMLHRLAARQGLTAYQQLRSQVDPVGPWLACATALLLRELAEFFRRLPGTPPAFMAALDAAVRDAIAAGPSADRERAENRAAMREALGQAPGAPPPARAPTRHRTTFADLLAEYPPAVWVLLMRHDDPTRLSEPWRSDAEGWKKDDERYDDDRQDGCDDGATPGEPVA